MNETTTERLVITLEGERQNGGVTGFISWQRLASLMDRAGELRDTEKVVQFEADERGLHYIVEHAWRPGR